MSVGWSREVGCVCWIKGVGYGLVLVGVDEEKSEGESGIEDG